MISLRRERMVIGIGFLFAMTLVFGSSEALAQPARPQPAPAPADGATVDDHGKSGPETGGAETGDAETGDAETDALSEDRPFVGDPGGEPPPPPVRPTPPRREEPPARPEPPRRPVGDPPAKPSAPPKDLLVPPGNNVLTGQIGFSGGLTRHSTGGFQAHFGWSYQMSRFLWFDLIGNLGFGGSCRPVDRDDQGRIIDSDCGGFRGIGIDLLAGVQLKFLNVKHWTAPVVPFVRVAAGAAFIVTDTPNDGAAMVVRAGGGARYYFSPRFSVGGELAFMIGPAWRNHLQTGAYAAIALLGGVEFLL